MCESLLEVEEPSPWKLLTRSEGDQLSDKYIPPQFRLSCLTIAYPFQGSSRKDAKEGGHIVEVDHRGLEIERGSAWSFSESIIY